MIATQIVKASELQRYDKVKRGERWHEVLRVYRECGNVLVDLRGIDTTRVLKPNARITIAQRIA